MIIFKYMRYGIVYKITNLINNKVYIGQTIRTLSQRWNLHCSNRKVNKSAIHSAIMKYGKENFSIEIIEEADSIEELNKKEYDCVQKFNSIAPLGYNIKEGGGSKGKFSEEFKKEFIKKRNTKEYLEKISKKAKERWNKKTEQEKEEDKIKLLLLRKSEKASINLKKANDRQWSDLEKRKRFSEFSKKQWLDENYRKSRSGTNHPLARQILCVELNRVFVSIIDAGKFIDQDDFLNKSKNINACCLNKQKTAFGYRWRYY